MIRSVHRERRPYWWLEMGLSQNPHAYRFDNFLEETRNLITKSKVAVYFHLIFLRKYVWEDLEDLMEAYSVDGRRNWEVALLKTQQDDFYILQFMNKNDESERHSFFWKVITEEDKMIILSFSLEKFRFITSCLESFAEFANMEFPWLGSAFLENLDYFIHTTFGADARIIFKRILYDLEPIAGKGKPETNLNFTALSKEEILKRKQTEYAQRNKFFYIRRMNVSVLWKGGRFLFSISDESKIMFKRGDLITFLEMINALKNRAKFYRNSAEKRLNIDVKEKLLEEGKKTEARTIQNLEVLKLNIDNPMTENWYANFTSLFSEPYKREEKLMSFVLMRGNPYFLAQVIDLEKGGSGVYLSATENSIRISPSGNVTNISTVLKIIKVLQKYVDPNITIAGA